MAIGFTKTALAKAAHEAAADYLLIDGSKKPEMIPRWLVWQTVFRAIELQGTIEGIPTVVYKLLSPRQRSFVIAEVLALKKQEQDSFARALKLREGLTSENMPARASEAAAIDMELRRASLDTRDRILAALPLEAQSALSTFVEEAKKGITYTVLKSDLGRFRQPE